MVTMFGPKKKAYDAAGDNDLVHETKFHHVLLATRTVFKIPLSFHEILVGLSGFVY